jgi:hypothetical protein
VIRRQIPERAIKTTPMAICTDFAGRYQLRSTPTKHLSLLKAFVLTSTDRLIFDARIPIHSISQFDFNHFVFVTEASARLIETLLRLAKHFGSLN